MTKKVTRVKIVAANWKMYKTPEETRAFFSDFKKIFKPNNSQVVFFPPAYNLHALKESIVNLKIDFGAQNIGVEKEGAFTGELSPFVIENLGAKYALIGHSERRSLFGETDSLIAKKVKAALEFRLIPMLCVGETLKERENGTTENVLTRQLSEGLSLLTGENLAQLLDAASGAPKLVIAYEPVWAIGTGVVASPDQAEAAHEFIRKLLAQKFSAEFAAATSILYGGSVKPANAMELSQKPNIDGFLVGGASLVPQDFAKIVEVYR